MKPQLLKVAHQMEHSFSVRHDILPYFYNQLHYHEELELVYIISGTGTQFIGDCIENFKSKDLLLVGSNLPHLWRSDSKYILRKTTKLCEAYVIHFNTSCFGSNFFDLPENGSILKLFTIAKHGIKIEENTKLSVISKIEALLQAQSSKRIMLLLEILQTISDSDTIQTICNNALEFRFDTVDSERLNMIYQYLIKNYAREIPLKEIASVAYLSPNSFCRYFKSRVKKSFSKFLIEIRIAQSCKMLTETENPIVNIAYSCGYNNFTNFYRHFKSITQKTPLQYRKEFTSIYQL